MVRAELVRAVVAELIHEQLLPAFPDVGTPEQRVARLFASVDGGHAEVVERRPVEVQDDRTELERLGDSPDDRREHAVEILLAAPSHRETLLGGNDDCDRAQTLRLRWFLRPGLSRSRRLRPGIFVLCIWLLSLPPFICILLRRLPLLLCSCVSGCG